MDLDFLIQKPHYSKNVSVSAAWKCNSPEEFTESGNSTIVSVSLKSERALLTTSYCWGFMKITRVLALDCCSQSTKCYWDSM